MRARARGMTLSMVGIGLFKTQGLDEYGTAAVGWLRGAGLKAREGPAEHQRRRDPNAPSHTLCTSAVHTHTHTRTHTVSAQTKQPITLTIAVQPGEQSTHLHLS